MALERTFSFRALREKLSGYVIGDRSREKETVFALRDHTPTAGLSKYLAFKKGDRFRLDSVENGVWWLVTPIGGKTSGLVPSNCVARESEHEIFEWCNLDCSRTEAENELRKEEYDAGAFVVRPSSSKELSEALALSVKFDSDTILHYTILRASGQLQVWHGNSSSIKERRFTSLTKLLKHHARNYGGLRRRLAFSVKKKLDAWEIDPDEIVIGGQLGSGFFGEVRKGTLDGCSVAVKTMTSTALMTKEKFIEEAVRVRHLCHENIVRTIGICSNVPFIVTEFVPGGDLKNYLTKLIASAMAYLEKNNIIHRDLAARNVLVGKTPNEIKLADFGLARCLDEAVYYKAMQSIFPYKWTAPEAFVIEGQTGRCTSASDVWSYGVVLWELFSKGANPYSLMAGEVLLRQLTDGTLRLPCPTGCPMPIYKMMEECWSLDPAQRPTFAQLLNFLSEYSMESGNI